MADSTNEKSLSGRAALVTGAASGLGSRVAYDLAEAGALVGVLDWNPDEVAGVTQRIGSAGGHAFAMLADLADRSAVARAVDRFAVACSRLDILITCATVLPDRPLLAMDLDTWRTLTAVNVGGTLAATEAVAPVMERARYGRIVHLDSCTVHRGDGLDRGVAGSVLAPLTTSFAGRLGWAGVTVNCVMPGQVRPSVTALAGGTARRIAQVTPSCRWTRAEEVSGAVRFLVSADAGFVTGQVFHVRGAGGFIPAPRGVPV